MDFRPGFLKGKLEIVAIDVEHLRDFAEQYGIREPAIS